MYMCIYTHIYTRVVFSRGSVVKNLPASAGDTDLIPWLVRTPREGNGNPLQYSCLGNPLERGAWWVIRVGHDLVNTQHTYTSQVFDCAWLFATPWSVACQAPLSMGFFRHERWRGLPFLPPGNLPDLRIKPSFPVSPALADRFFTTEPPVRLYIYISIHLGDTYM